jgi:hypothetical protein
MILGMPGETYDSFLDGISSLIENGQHNRIQFGNLTILPNAEMGDPEYQKKFGMKIVETEIINIHGSLLENEEIFEHQQMVVETDSMPSHEWVKTRAICWMTAFLHFDKVMQIPFIMINKLCDLTFREMIESFACNNKESSPIISEIYNFFIEEAEKIQNGGPEYCESKKWLKIWWPADELQLIHLCTEDRLSNFYQEAENLMQRVLADKNIEIPKEILHEAIYLNHKLIKLPFQTEDLELSLQFNIWEFYQHQLIGENIPLLEKQGLHVIDRTEKAWSSWEEWCQEVIWYGNKKGAYLYKLHPSENTVSSSFFGKHSEEQIAGHY